MCVACVVDVLGDSADGARVLSYMYFPSNDAGRDHLFSDLTSSNDDLVNVYEVIRDQLDELLESLRKHRDGPDYYCWVRELPLKRKLTDVQRASRFIFLNKRCYNGLYRVNSKGEFNVPIGRYKTPPRIFDESNLRAISRMLRGGVRRSCTTPSPERARRR